jgi:precorrin-3B C17-methyltransferase
MTEDLIQKGILTIVGIGPGNDEHITPAALKAIAAAEFVIGYTTYIRLVKHLLVGKEIFRAGMTEEIGRARMAVERAKSGKNVVIISSGDAGVYGMAGLVFEVLKETGWKRDQSPELRLIPGVTAANSCASLVGAPLGHDSCLISLSDLLTPWPVIEKRIEAAAAADFVISLYNPASGRRTRQIVEARNIIGKYRDASTPVALVKSAYRIQQNIIISDLDHFLEYEIGMNTTVIVGSTNTFLFEGYMITPRGYANKYRWDGSVLEGQKKARSLNVEGSLQSKSTT